MKKQKMTKRFSFDSLITKTVLAFSVLIILILTLGTVSYLMAKQMIMQEAENALVKTITAKGDYLELGLQQVDDKMLEILTADDMSVFYLGQNIDISNLTDEQGEAKNTVQAKIRDLKTISDFVYHVYFFSNNAAGLTTTPVKMTGDYYTAFKESDMGKVLDSTNEKFGYLGTHPYLEELVKAEDKTFKSSEYALSMWRKVTKMDKTAIFIVDIDRKVINAALKDLDRGEGSYAVLIAPDNNVTMYSESSFSKKNEETIPAFTEIEAYKSALNSNNTEGFEQIKWQGKAYTFAYSKLGNTGAMIVSLVPTDTFLESTKIIQLITVLMVSAAFVVAIAMCLFLSRSMSKGFCNI